MQKLILLTSLCLLSIQLLAQKGNEQQFYSFLQASVRQAILTNDSVTVIEENKTCFGGSWKSIILVTEAFCTIKFYSDKLTADTLSPFKMILDTSYSIPTKNFLASLAKENNYLKQHLIISHSSFIHSVALANKTKRFILTKGSLYFLLRFNKSSEMREN